MAMGRRFTLAKQHKREQNDTLRAVEQDERKAARKAAKRAKHVARKARRNKRNGSK